ncbi:MAG: cytidylate kinase-like family protein [Chloroflexi bacterium]|nr:cytidylate kinase-like family protein [Chloroflexota bacterium]
MPVVTINGQIGSGARPIGIEVARTLGVDYVDRLILAEAGKRVGATVAALAEKEQRTRTFGDRLARVVQTALERSAVAGTGGDPFFGPGVDALVLRPYPEGAHEPITRAQELDDLRFFQVLSEVIRDLAKTGNVVLIGRGANLILQGWPRALHVGIVSSTKQCVEAIMQREHLDRAAAERFVTEQEKARVVYFRRFFKTHPDDPHSYHMVLNTALLSSTRVVEAIASAARSMAEG